jgi:hypothetical protein
VVVGRLAVAVGAAVVGDAAGAGVGAGGAGSAGGWEPSSVGAASAAGLVAPDGVGAAGAAPVSAAAGGCFVGAGVAVAGGAVVGAVSGAAGVGLGSGGAVRPARGPWASWVTTPSRASAVGTTVGASDRAVVGVGRGGSVGGAVGGGDVGSAVGSAVGDESDRAAGVPRAARLSTALGPAMDGWGDMPTAITAPTPTEPNTTARTRPRPWFASAPPGFDRGHGS